MSSAPSMPLRIVHHKSIERTPAIRFLTEAWLSLREQDLVIDTTFTHWQDECLLAYHESDPIDDFPIGVISFVEQAHDKSIVIKIGFVRSDFRRQSVYEQLWCRLVSMARDRKMMAIYGATQMKNELAIKMFEALGREAHSITYEFKL